MKNYRGEFRYHRESTDSWVTETCLVNKIYDSHEPFDGFEIVDATYTEIISFDEFKRLCDENHK